MGFCVLVIRLHDAARAAMRMHIHRTTRTHGLLKGYREQAFLDWGGLQFKEAAWARRPTSRLHCWLVHISHRRLRDRAWRNCWTSTFRMGHCVVCTLLGLTMHHLRSCGLADYKPTVTLTPVSPSKTPPPGDAVRPFLRTCANTWGGVGLNCRVLSRFWHKASPFIGETRALAAIRLGM